MIALREGKGCCRRDKLLTYGCLDADPVQLHDDGTGGVNGGGSIVVRDRAAQSEGPDAHRPWGTDE
jgi:hypothetical protein